MSGDATLWLDGNPIDALPLPDRGLNYGDGLFETLLLRGHRPQFLSLHLARLQSGMHALSLRANLERVQQQLYAAADSVADVPWSVLRLTITRGGGPRGYTPTDNPRVRVVIQVDALDRDCSLAKSPAAIGMPAHRLATQPALAGIKHLNRLDQVMAAAQAREQGYAEGLMLDQTGDVVSVIAGNLFIVRNGELVTPPLHQCGVAGTRRTLVLQQLAREADLAVQEQPLSLEDIHAAHECFYTNSLVGIRGICALGETRWDQFPVTHALFDLYRGKLT